MNTEKRTYHHGGLRDALIEAAVLILEEEGIAKMSLRSIARKAGVSQAAPYSHFANKSALLIEVAAFGFSKFSSALENPVASGDTPDDLREHLAKLGVVYVNFAMENKALFQLMFGDALSHISKSETYLKEGERAYNCIDKAVRRLKDEAAATLAAWSMVHGLATLMVDQKINVAPDVGNQVRSILQFLSLK
ncbi:MAG: TetR/AcrR family transcriptional regulator [Sneathiella sp.]|nr:TetR/AcrR family transcriptional regulator [Sneathiella sp.]